MADLGNILLNLVLILAAGAVGAILSGLIAQLAVRWTIRRDAPQVVVQAVRALGGLTSMVLAYLLLSTGGAGFGWGPGGFGFGNQGNITGTGQETGKGTGTGNGVAVTTQEPQEKLKGTEKKVEKTDKVDPPPALLKVEMLGGKRYQADSNRFYLIEGDKEARTLAELSGLMQEKQKLAGFPGIEIIIYRTGSVAATHGAVKDLKDRAMALGLPVKTTILDQDAPPLP